MIELKVFSDYQCDDCDYKKMFTNSPRFVKSANIFFANDCRYTVYDLISTNVTRLAIINRVSTNYTKLYFGSECYLCKLQRNVPALNSASVVNILLH